MKALFLRAWSWMHYNVLHVVVWKVLSPDLAWDVIKASRRVMYGSNCNNTDLNLLLKSATLAVRQRAN